MKKIIKYTFAIILLIFSGCLKDAPITQFVNEQNNSADILVYLETQGDYINSNLMPSLLTADNIFNNPGDKIILDIRSVTDFANGHIQNAINILPNDILNYLKTANPNKTIVLVSQSGQSASYYTGLLRLYGYTNIFALKFGMTSWNMNFANIWIDAVQDISNFTNKVFDKPQTTPLPDIILSNTEGSIKEKTNRRIQELMGLIFSEINKSDVSVSVEDLSRIFFPITADYLNTYVVCYGQYIEQYLFGLYPFDPGKPGHLPSAVYYLANTFDESDLRSSAYLQTIPSNKDIVVYSRIGHLSAFITAYLRLLGYNAKSLLFGMNWRVDLKEGFNLGEVHNYPYVTGQ